MEFLLEHKVLRVAELFNIGRNKQQHFGRRHHQSVKITIFVKSKYSGRSTPKQAKF